MRNICFIFAFKITILLNIFNKIYEENRNYNGADA